MDLSIKMLSLFPAENVQGDVLQPFRTDILEYLKDLKPRYDNGKRTQEHMTLLGPSRKARSAPQACVLHSKQTAVEEQAWPCTDLDKATQR